MGRVAQAAKAILSHIGLFSRGVIGIPLRTYQLRTLAPIIKSILRQEGHEYLIIFPRQSGKNEAIAHLLVYLLNLLQRAGGNIVYGAIGDGLGRGIQRLEDRLDNKWNHGRWRKAHKPIRRLLGKAAVVFLSSHPQAAARGETAHWLLIIDEMQDQDLNHLEAVFTPMRAANNAAAIYMGTVRVTTDALWKKKAELERIQREKGSQRVFIVKPDEVCKENPAYKHFLNAQVARHGRNHPIIASEYYLEPIDGSGGLFDARRRRLMLGTHERCQSPGNDNLFIATIDVGGQDEASTDPLSQLANPSRDYTVATIHHLIPPDGPAPGPTYHALDVFVDHGSRHFQDYPGRPSLVKRLIAWLETWNTAHLIIDSSGVGEGMADWLTAAFPNSVTSYQFTPTRKAQLGSSFLSIIETGRFKYWCNDMEVTLSDGWWFWQQAQACTYELPAGGQFDKHLRWYVPTDARVSTPTGPELIHDDRLISAALIAVADDLWRSGDISAGQARSSIIKPTDPLADLKF